MSRPEDPSTILLHGDDTSRYLKDGIAQAAITPGELLEVQGTEDTGADMARQLAPQSSAAVPVATRVALEYGHTGRGTDSDYETDDHVEYHHFKKGEEAYMWLADGENVTVDDLLVSDGTGALRAAAGDGTEDAAAVFVATEAVDNTSGSPARIRAEVI
jgi:hypothetical protein